MIDIERLRADVRAHADRVAIALLGDKYDHTGAELRFGRKGSMSVVIAGSKAGTWYDHQSQEGGDLLALIMREHRCEFIPACEIAGEILAQRYDQPPRPGTPREISDQDRWRSAINLYQEARPISGTLAEAYLRQTRRIDLDILPNLDHVLRFHPSCPFKPMRRHPCLLALYRDIITDVPRAILRIATDGDLTKLGMLSLGPTRGAAIKLSPDAEVTTGLCVAEGLETALSAMMVEDDGAWLRPMWALGGTSGLLTFPALPGVERLTILIDHDPIDPKTGLRPGAHAAAVCARRWFDAGRRATRLTPRELGDFNDLLRREGAA